MGREMGGRFRRERIYVYLWMIHVKDWQKTTKFCKAIILQLKKKGWGPKNLCLGTVTVEKTLESPLDSKDIKLVNLKENQHWKFIGRTDAIAESLILWPPDSKHRLTRKDHDAGLKAGGEGNGGGWDGWMASLIQWTWAWANSGIWWSTGKQQSTGSEWVRHNWATEQQQNNFQRCSVSFPEKRANFLTPLEERDSISLWNCG